MYLVGNGIHSKIHNGEYYEVLNRLLERIQLLELYCSDLSYDYKFRINKLLEEQEKEQTK